MTHLRALNVDRDAAVAEVGRRRANGGARSSASSSRSSERRDAAEEKLAAAQRPARGALPPLLRRPVGGRPDRLPAESVKTAQRDDRLAARAPARAARGACAPRRQSDCPTPRRPPGSPSSGGASSRRSTVIARPSSRGSCVNSRSSLPRRARSTAQRAAEVEEARQARQQSEAGLEAARQAVRDAERGVEAARREAASVGGELAAVNHFLRGQETGPRTARGRSPTSSRSTAAMSSRSRRRSTGGCEPRWSPTGRAAASLLDRAGDDGGRALVAPDDAARRGRGAGRHARRRLSG